MHLSSYPARISSAFALINLTSDYSLTISKLQIDVWSFDYLVLCKQRYFSGFFQKMETGTATEQMAVNYENPCKLCLITKTYRRYAPKTTNQGVYHNKVWSCTEFARLLHKIRIFCLGQMNVLLWTPSKSIYKFGWCNLFQLNSIPHFGRWALREFLRRKKNLVGLLAVSTLSYWMSPLARIALPQTTWPTRVPPCWRRAECGRWFNVTHSAAGLPSSNHPQILASHLLGLQGPQQKKLETKEFECFLLCTNSMRIES
jgi:hypothetical protein